MKITTTATTYLMEFEMVQTVKFMIPMLNKMETW